MCEICSELAKKTKERRVTNDEQTGESFLSIVIQMSSMLWKNCLYNRGLASLGPAFCAYNYI